MPKSNNPIIEIGHRVASLKLTVALFALSLFLVLIATLVQRTYSSFDAKSEYITKAIIFVDWQVFFPSHFELEGGFYYPGGMILGALLLVNLLAAHSLRFKMKARGNKLILGSVLLIIGSVLIVTTFAGLYIKEFYPQLAVAFIGTLILIPATYQLFAKRGGIVLMHAGIVLLLLGELGTWYFQHEANMTIEEGSYAHYTENSREFEIAFVKTADDQPAAEKNIAEDNSDSEDKDEPKSIVAAKNKEIILPHGYLERIRPYEMPLPDPELKEKPIPEAGPIVNSDQLPVKLRIDRWFVNALPEGTRTKNIATPLKSNTENLATDGYGKDGTNNIKVTILPRATDGSSSVTDVNYATCYVTLWAKDAKDSDEPLGTWLLSTFYDAYGLEPQTIELDGKSYSVSLRHKREYKDYAFHLNKVTHDIFDGTNIPKNFQSDIQIQPALATAGNQDSWRLTKIYMNNPLRYRGETFYQYQMSAGEGRTVLQVVRNPVWGAPYVSCIIMAVGMAMHFSIMLINYINKQRL